ncbi:MAG: ATP-binding cassette domain-containing protein [Myxococcaceae bacterium]|nr:ATP-binding cassette domain-containing protein [Myxococcaceae bacterium]
MQLSTQALTVVRGRTPALDGVSLKLERGDHLQIHGPAGGGKTTLLKALAGLIRPSTGTVRWDALDPWALTSADRRAHQRHLGFVFQSDALFDSLTVEHNVRLPLERRGVPDDEARARAREALERVGLTAAALKRPESLSGGMRKRVGLARAVVTAPEVLLADDPFAGLDPDTEREMAALLLEVASARTLLVALPDPSPALPMPHRRLADGRLE